MAGESVALVAADTPFSLASAKRHLRNHLCRDQLVRMRSLRAADLHVEDFMDRLASLADESASIRDSAANPRTKLLAVREEREALSVLMTRLGVDSEEMAEVVREARALAAAVSIVLADEPSIAVRLARELASRGEPDAARAFTELADRASARPVQSVAGPRRPAIAGVGA